MMSRYMSSDESDLRFGTAVLVAGVMSVVCLGCTADGPVDESDGESANAGAVDDADAEPGGDRDAGDVGEHDSEGDSNVDDDPSANGDSGSNGDSGANDDEFEVPEGMVLIPEGTYTRGCNTGVDEYCSDPDRLAHDHENPAHEVRISAFVIDRLEVTEQEYAQCVTAGVCEEPYHQYDDDYDGMGDDYPVVNVTSSQAITYCEWVDKRLPTEAEWEKAARGTDRRIYPWGDDEPDCNLANYDACGQTIEPVGQRPDAASPYGVEDMAGNVRNWTADWFDADYYEESPDDDPQGPDSGVTRTVRGGSFHFGASSLRTSARYSMEGGADSFSYEVGFRCARSVAP